MSKGLFDQLADDMDFAQQIKHDQEILAANNAEWIEWMETSGVFQIPVGHSIRSVEPHHGEFEHNPDCKVCKWQERKKSLGEK